jgi:hypothetical protein
MACGNNLVVRAGLTAASALGHPSPGASGTPGGHRSAISQEQVKTATSAVQSAVESVARQSAAARSAGELTRAAKDARRALESAQRLKGVDVRTRRALIHQAEDALAKVGAAADRLADEELRQRLARESALANHLGQFALGTVRGQVVQEHTVALYGLSRFVPQYSQHVDARLEGQPHLPRERWDDQADPLPLPPGASLAPGQRIMEVARTVTGDIAFLNQDGVPLAATFTVDPHERTPRGDFIQRRLQKVFKGTGLDAGHMGRLANGGLHLLEFATGQTPRFNRGGQGGFEKAIAAAAPGVALIEISMVVDVPLGAVGPRGYWFRATGISEDGSRTPIPDATNYFTQAED